MSLEAFVKQLDRAGELVRISAPVSPRLEITEVTDRFSGLEGGGKALLFENTGTAFPLLINALGSEERIRLAFRGRSPGELASEMHAIIGLLTGGDTGFAGKLRKIPLIGKAARWMPRKVRGRGACQEVVAAHPDLSALPVLTCWPFDGGPFITLPLVHTVDPSTGSRNLGMYRMQVFSSEETGMHWHMHKTGARHYREYSKAGIRMPVAVALGGDPVYTYCATAPLPDGIDEYLLAGFIRNKPVRMVKCLTQDLWVPEDCDIILEGYVDPGEPLRTEGPFGDHTGFYSLEDRYPVFHLTALTHRKRAVYPATIVGIPPQEDAWLAWATERLFKPMIRMALVPELTDFHLPVAGVAHNIVLASIEKSYPGQARKVIHSLWGAGQMMFSKFIALFSGEVSLTDYRQLAIEVSRRVNPASDIALASGPLDVLDHSSRSFAFGGKMGIDATGPAIYNELPADPQNLTEAAMAFRSSHPEVTEILVDWANEGISLGLVAVIKTHPGTVRDIQDEIRLNDTLNQIRFWILLEGGTNLRNPGEVAWLTGSHVDAGTDVRILQAGQGGQSGMVFIDATVKTAEFDGFGRPWPNPTVMDPETIRMVDGKWKDYGVGPLIRSRSGNLSDAYRPGAVREG